VKVNISIDDICPHPKSSVNVLKKCSDLIDVFPDIKFTLFVPMAYTRLNEESYHLRDYPRLCDTLRELDKKYFELGWHGYLHGIVGKSHNDEFRHLNTDDAITVLNNMFKEANAAKLMHDFKSILRPPAFYMSDGSFEACKKMGIEMLALSPYADYRNRNIEFAKAIYFDALPPIYPLIKKDKIEIVYHASEWSKNFLNDELANDLIKFLSLESKPEFVFMEDF